MLAESEPVVIDHGLRPSREGVPQQFAESKSKQGSGARSFCTSSSGSEAVVSRAGGRSQPPVVGDQESDRRSAADRSHRSKIGAEKAVEQVELGMRPSGWGSVAISHGSNGSDASSHGGSTTRFDRSCCCRRGSLSQLLVIPS